MKGDVARRLYGRYKGLDLLKDLEEEHLREAKDPRWTEVHKSRPSSSTPGQWLL